MTVKSATQYTPARCNAKSIVRNNTNKALARPGYSRCWDDQGIHGTLELGKLVAASEYEKEWAPQLEEAKL